MITILRRSFLVSLGLGAGGLALGWSDAEAAPTTKPSGATLTPNPFVHIDSAGVVSIVCHRSEMGQGVRSTLHVLIADELGADLARVIMIQADGDEKYGDQNTDGSHSIRGQFEKLRKSGAAARMMLTQAAAKHWKVKPQDCSVRDHQVFDKSGRRSLAFAALVEDAAALSVPADKDIVLRPRSELPHLGKALPLLDAPAIVTGKGIFGADVKLPGMLTAVVMRPPVVGGKVMTHDPAPALAVPGVKKVIVLPAPKRPFAFQPLGGVAVIADNTWAAMRGRAALQVTWEAGDNGAYESTAYRATLIASVAKEGKVHRNVGDAEGALAKSEKKVEATYTTPHLAHVPMEPPVAVAHVKDGGCVAWAPTQNPQAAQKEVAKALGLTPDKVVIHVTLLGGGFGRKSKPDFVVEAALLSRAMGAPVRVQWTREDDVQHDYYHSTSAQRLVAGLDSAGKLVAWHHRSAFPPIPSIFKDVAFSEVGEMQQGAIDTPLSIPNVRVENCEAKAYTRIGWLRSVANIYHAFAIQSFIDELAHARGMDPLDNMLDVLGPARIVKPSDLGVEKLPNYGQSTDEHPVDTARHRRVLERVCDLAKWRDRKKDGRSMGLAVHRSFLTYVAVVLAVSKDAEDKLRVDEAWIVADAGTIVNAERVDTQLQGAVVFGLSHALHGAITMKNGATTQTNFRDFKLMRIGDTPKRIHVDVIASEGPPGGIGEPGVPPVAPALANAVFALTGTRVRDLPIGSAMRV